jgi:hypothetical protein
MAFHAKKSASGSKQWIKCSGSLPLIAKMPPELRRPSGAAAMLGTCAHGLGEWCLERKLREVPEALMGTVVWLCKDEDAHLTEEQLPGIDTTAQLSAELGVDVKFMARVDEKMREGVQLYLDVCWETVDAAGATAEYFIERRFDMSWLRPDMGGTSDMTVWQFLGRLTVIDYKNGYVNVEAEGNTQAPYYGLGMAHEVEWMFEDIEVIIVQPNARGPKVKRWVLTKKELEEFKDMLATASDRVDEAGEMLEKVQDEVDMLEWAGTYLSPEPDGVCTFCDVFATCPAAKMMAEQLAREDFRDPVPLDNEFSVVDEEAALDRLTTLIRWGPWLDGLVKAAQTLGQRRLEQGLEVPGQKLVRGKANRKWSCTDGEVAALIASKVGVPVSECFEEPKDPPLKSPAQMEKLGAARSKERKLAKEMVAQLAFTPEGKLTMAPESDPREAVVPTTAADDFVDDVETNYGE